MVLEIDTLDQIFSTDVAFRYIKIGDPGLIVGDGWKIGGFTEFENQENLISFNGTTTQISQQIDIDKGRGSSVSSISVALIDKNQIVSKLVSPGVTLEEILSKKCRLYLGFKNSAFPDDYIVIFRGIVDEIESGPGFININLSHPDTKKRQQLFTPGDTTLDGAINNSVTTITVDSTAKFLAPVLAHDGDVDDAIQFHIKIDDEIIRYTSVTDTQFLGCTRAALGTIAASHNNQSAINSVYRLHGNLIDLALKLMLSGTNDSFADNISAKSFNQSGFEYIPNSIFFGKNDLVRNYNVVIGDFVTVEFAVNTDNNITKKKIIAVNKNTDGYFIVVEGVTFVDELETEAKITFYSQYDSLGYGLGLGPDEVDISQHTNLKALFLSSFEYDFRLKDEIDAKDFIEQQLYLPASCYSLPRKSQASIGVLAPPLPDGSTTLIDESKILRPNEISVKRSIGKNFLNTLIFKFEKSAISDKYEKALVITDEDSLNRIAVGTKSLTIESDGLRSVLNAENLVQAASKRRIDRYKFAAEYLENIQVTYGAGYSLEVGDTVILDASKIKITNFSDGTRVKPPTLFQIINKRINIKTGEVRIDLLNTGFSLDQIARYGLISPSSKIKTSLNDTTVVVKPSFLQDFGDQEGAKWSRYIGCAVIVRSEDYSEVSSAIIKKVDYNTITFQDNLFITPAENFILELDSYNNQPDFIKLKYVFMNDNPAFDDDRGQYTML